MHENMPIAVGLFFLLGLIAAAYSSADSGVDPIIPNRCFMSCMLAILYSSIY